jgi:hypothetical protein
MTLAQGDKKRRYGLFWPAVVLLLSGVVVNLTYFNDFVLRSLGLLMLCVGVFLIRASNVRGLMGTRVTNQSYAKSQVSKRPGPLAWTVSGASAVGMVVFYIFMSQANRAGGHEVWPVYAFGGCAFVATLAFGYLVAKFSA